MICRILMPLLFMVGCIANSKFKNPTDGYNGYIINILLTSSEIGIRSTATGTEPGTNTGTGTSTSQVLGINAIVSNAPVRLTKGGFDVLMGLRLSSSVSTDTTLSVTPDTSSVISITPNSFIFTSSNFASNQFSTLAVSSISLGTTQTVVLQFSGSLITTSSISIIAQDSIYPFPVMKTGLTLCYNANNTISCNDPGFPNQDGDYNLLVGTGFSYSGPILVNSSDRITKDLSTGLTWTSCSLGLVGANCTGTASLISQSQSITECSNLNSGNGYGNIKVWRLPKIFEIRSILNLSTTDLVQLSAFPSNQRSAYWSSSNDILNSGTKAMTMDFTGGEILSQLKSSSHYVRCVAGP